MQNYEVEINRAKFWVDSTPKNTLTAYSAKLFGIPYSHEQKHVLFRDVSQIITTKKTWLNCPTLHIAQKGAPKRDPEEDSKKDPKRDSKGDPKGNILI